MSFFKIAYNFKLLKFLDLKNLTNYLYFTITYYKTPLHVSLNS